MAVPKCILYWKKEKQITNFHFKKSHDSKNIRFTTALNSPGTSKNHVPTILSNLFPCSQRCFMIPLMNLTSELARKFT